MLKCIPLPAVKNCCSHRQLLIYTYQYTEESFYSSEIAHFEQFFEGNRLTEMVDQQQPSQMIVQVQLEEKVVRCSHSTQSFHQSGKTVGQIPGKKSHSL